MKRKLTVIFSLVMAFLLLASTAVSAERNLQDITEEPMYESFTYAVSQGKTYLVESPAPYRPVGKITAETLGVEFSAPSDMYVADGEIYISDSAENSIICTDLDFNVKKVIKEFTLNGAQQTFSEPLGVCFVGGKLYIADSGNRRVVILNSDGSLVSVIERPESALLSDTLDFIPQKVDVDADGRIYVIVKGVYEGIMEFYENGTFGGFVGSIPDSPDPLTVFWKKIMTKEQSEKLENFIPVEYTNMTLDSDGFVYTVSLTAEERDCIRRLNAAGSDILLREALGSIPVTGAVACENVDGSDKLSSNLEDIAVAENGTYYVLDSKYGRIYTYDSRGNMLFAFSSINTGQNGMSLRPTALSLVGNSLCVSDGDSGSITVFDRTDYASMIFEATELYRNDKYEESIEAWNSVLQYNSNFMLAYSMIGKALYQMGDYREAMDYYHKSVDQAGYSKAFERWRDNIFSEYFFYIVAGIVLIIAVIWVASALYKRYRKKHPAKERQFVKDLRYPLYVIFHPFDGFWDLKHEKRGKVWVSTLLIVLTIVTMTIERGLTGFAVSPTPDYPVDIIYQLKLVLVPIILFLVGNIAITTLMDGKGSFENIYVAAGYTLTPLILIKLPLVLVSNIMTQSEAVYVGLLNSLALIWIAFLVFSALLSIHEYTLGKTVGTVAITGVAMVIICFICVLFFSLFSELVGFVYTVIRETQYR